MEQLIEQITVVVIAIISILVGVYKYVKVHIKPSSGDSSLTNREVKNMLELLEDMRSNQRRYSEDVVEAINSVEQYLRRRDVQRN